MSNEVLQSIIGSKSICFHAIYAKAIGSVPAGVMLSQALFWQEQAKHSDFLKINGRKFFKKSNDEWYEETGITVDQQKTARGHLNRSGILLEQLAGMPATVHYHVDLEALVAVISRYLETGRAVAVNSRNKSRELPRTGSGKFRQQVAVNSGSTYIETKGNKVGDKGETKSVVPDGTAQIKVEVFEMEADLIEIEVEPEAKPEKPPSWTFRAKELFLKVYGEKTAEAGEPSEWSWEIGADQNWRFLKLLKEKGIVPDYEKKYNRKPTDDELDASFEAVFIRAWEYLARISKDKQQPFVNFTPASVYNNYNILKTAKNNGNINPSAGTANVGSPAFNTGINDNGKFDTRVGY
jgi:hypothetical protein